MYKIIDTCPKYDFLIGESDSDRIDEIINKIKDSSYCDICNLLNVKIDDIGKLLILVGDKTTTYISVDGNIEIFIKDINGVITVVPNNIENDRILLCNKCDHNVNGKCVDILKNGVIEKGCDCDIDSKVSIPVSTCPINKWGAYHE